MKIQKTLNLILTLGVLLFLLPAQSSQAATLHAEYAIYGGTKASWPTAWFPLNGLNDGNDAITQEHIDIVGDTSNPAVYVAQDNDYCYFRIRVQDGSATNLTFDSDTMLIMIDNTGDNSPDYAFVWDSQSSHGLEMSKIQTAGDAWNHTRFDDVDGNSGQKFSPPDFGTANGDGYIRILNNQTTTNFGNTTLVDFAIRWNYLTSVSTTTLDKGQTWNIQIGTINNANDHNLIDYDVAGNRNPADLGTTFPGWVNFSPTAIELTRLESQSTTGWQASVWLLIFSILALLKAR